MPVLEYAGVLEYCYLLLCYCALVQFCQGDALLRVSLTYVLSLSSGKDC